ncbi:hypothetical protein LTR95_002515 [Oleoguttula sp. CCFEE 5521]
MVPNRSPSIAISVNDFTVLPLRIPGLPSYPKDTTHYLYLRANAPKAPTADTSREVFLVNVPMDTTDVHLRSLFADQLGGARVESVAFEGARVGKGITAPVAPARKKRKRGQEDGEAAAPAEVGLLPEVWDRDTHCSGGTAIVTFVDKPSAELALREARRAVKSGRTATWGEGVDSKVPALGLARYAAHHKLRHPSHQALQESIDAYMTTFAAQEAARAKALARQRAEPDEDGFTTVVRGGRSDPAREDAVRQKEEELKKRQEKMIGEGFYKFQHRERKKKEAQALVGQFEMDRKRVEEMRKRRGG